MPMAAIPNITNLLILNFSDKTASITSRLEIIGPIPIDDSCQFLVLMSCGLCKTLKELHANDVQQFIRSIVQQVGTKTRQYIKNPNKQRCSNIPNDNHSYVLNLH